MATGRNFVAISIQTLCISPKEYRQKRASWTWPGAFHKGRRRRETHRRDRSAREVRKTGKVRCSRSPVKTVGSVGSQPKVNS